MQSQQTRQHHLQKLFMLTIYVKRPVLVIALIFFFFLPAFHEVQFHQVNNLNFS